ncbi:MAG: hypothetical protein IKQ92_12665 [Clostridia bacterium]|nr:hypothetical protein [Clostridia bacterium]
MGILSKLLKNAGAEKAVNSFLKSLASSSASSPAQPAPSAPQSPAVSHEAPVRAAHGLSWGEDMPAAENQYSYSGSYVDYFLMILREDFPGYRAEHQPTRPGNGTLFRLFDANGLALVMEVLSETSESKKTRTECRARGIPYVRFYHNHHGWWNVRSYVRDRIANALAGR